jgi:hypothetical protein
MIFPAYGSFFAIPLKDKRACCRPLGITSKGIITGKNTASLFLQPEKRGARGAAAKQKNHTLFTRKSTPFHYFPGMLG